MSRRRWRGRVLLAGSLGAFAAAAFLACQGDAVLIGIESDAGPSVLRITPVGSAQPPPPGLSMPDATPGLTPLVSDAAPWDCLPDGGCPLGMICSYPVDAGCGAIGECFIALPIPAPPAGPGASERTVALVPEGYSQTSLACDGGSPPDAATGDANAGVEDARGD